MSENETNKIDERSDRNFDSLKDLFLERIYGTIKGNYRLDMTIQDLESELDRRHLPCTGEQPLLTALDVGGGLGQITTALAQKTIFESVVYYDISTEMKLHVDRELELGQGDERTQDKCHAKVITRVGGLRQAILDQGSERNETNFNSPDVVCLHAVLEWLSKPMDDLDHLLKFMESGSILSLLYYNNIASHKSAGESKPRRKPRKPSKLTPFHEFENKEIESMLTRNEFEITRRTGLRVKKFKRDGSEEELKKYLNEERQIARLEPFCRQGRYNHVIAVKK